MTLHWSPKSPYVRQVMVAAHELQLVEHLTLVRSVALMQAPNAALMAVNPLNKIPTLVREDGSSLIDSRVIIEYLDALRGGGTLLPADGERWWVLANHALINGLLDVLILWRNEREKPVERQTPEWLSAFTLKLDATLCRLEGLIGEFSSRPFGLAHIALGCMLSYLDFRFAALVWRDAHPALAGWHREFEARPSAAATAIREG